MDHLKHSELLNYQNVFFWVINLVINQLLSGMIQPKIQCLGGSVWQLWVSNIPRKMGSSSYA
jgi:hypothetical protein